MSPVEKNGLFSNFQPLGSRCHAMKTQKKKKKKKKKWQT